MAETVRGGLYIGEDGRWHDAEGRVVEGTPEPVQVDGVDDMDTVDAESEPAPSTKKRGK